MSDLSIHLFFPEEIPTYSGIMGTWKEIELRELFLSRYPS